MNKLTDQGPVVKVLAGIALVLTVVNLSFVVYGHISKKKKCKCGESSEEE